ncbi:MAG: septum formation initiator family protein [Porphyromonadaceae bacterium]|nr:septum formation initiator family protein [Porphyromonadaceae bacterium]
MSRKIWSIGNGRWLSTGLDRLNVWDKKHRWAKYIIVLALLSIYTFVLREPTIWEYTSLLRRQIHIQNEIDSYRPIYEADSTRLSNLKTGKDRIEHIARERYLMKSPGEEIYIIKPAENE